MELSALDAVTVAKANLSSAKRGYCVYSADWWALVSIWRVGIIFVLYKRAPTIRVFFLKLRTNERPLLEYSAALYLCVIHAPHISSFNSVLVGFFYVDLSSKVWLFLRCVVQFKILRCN